MAPQIIDYTANVPNKWAGRKGLPIEYICLHVAEGGKGGVKSWFENPASEASSHYLVNKDGSIWQFVKEGDTAWTNGRMNKPNLADPLIKKYQDKGINPNNCGVTIETEGYHYEDLTPPQLAATAWLCADITRRHKLPNDGSRLFGHNEFDSVDRAHCPSLSRHEWAVIVAAVQGAPVATATPPAKVPAANPARSPGHLLPGQPDSFLWPDAEGIVVERMAVFYNPDKKKYYRLTWHHERGYKAELVY